MENEIRKAIIGRSRGGTIITAQILDACSPQLKKIVSGSPNYVGGLFVFWNIVRQIVDSDPAFSNPTHQPLAIWKLKVEDAEDES